ncbi:flavin reductase family protein [Lederbergia sp. NSJ-179]|uniref:flavin reductase family protein n=1 Tax=Lederbergia sp. NSJ-179 TaxID=2931402 RepID=UPI001FD5DAFD|nr:flavin reductase family protein [Lederbergia sp. NSJ-179]MCJ7842983.1 flavin reductase family protein [Lederbergia sp. NSJ-179]
MEKSINTTRYLEVMGNYPTGVTVVTTLDDQKTPLGLTVNSFTSLSLDPLLVLWSIDKKVSSYSVFTKTKQFAINVLASDQGDLCSLFARKNTDRFNQCEWHLSKLNLPILSGSAGVLQCKTYKTIEAGDHTMLIGEVIDILNENKKPLLYHQRKMGEIPESFYQ